MSNRFKTFGAVAVAAVMATSGVVALAPHAHADPPSGTNISGQESFDTDVFMDRVCGDLSTEDKGFIVNTASGEVVNARDAWGKEPYFNLAFGRSKSGAYHGPSGFHYALNPGWDYFQGNCEFPDSSSWTWHDTERRISDDTVTNCGSGTASLNVRESYATTRTVTKTVGVTATVGTKFSEIFTTYIGPNFSYAWAISKTHTLGRSVAVSVPPGRQGWISARPLKRTVRVNPVFKVNYYNWSDGQSEFGWVVHDWRGRGDDRIWSSGFFVDGVADVVNPDGTPAMDFVTRDSVGTC